MTRDKRSFVNFLLVLGGLALVASAQAPAPAPLVVHPLTKNVYWVEGAGGNSGVIVGDKGVVIIDAKITAAAGKELLEDVAKITPKPVTAVILTHSDRDHVNGLAAFSTTSTVIAQENEKKEEESAIATGGNGAPPADHLPTRLITKKEERIKLAGVPFELFHWAPAHTSGDLVIYLPEQKIVFTGDILTNRPDPLIHLEKHGSSEGWIKTAEAMLALDADTYVQGHGNPETKAEVEQYLKHVEAKRAQIKELVAQGKSLDEIKAAVGDPPPSQSGNGPAFPTFTEVVYRELTQK